jgi:arabinose-5-phosphate isomerase
MSINGNSELSEALVERSVEAARFAVETELAELSGLLKKIDDQIKSCLGILLACKGRVVVTGLGKPGHIGAKISATLSSTGTPSSFMHAVESLHGDSGALLPGDVLLAISNSGETVEVCGLAMMAQEMGIPVISMVGRTKSTLSSYSDVVLDVGVWREADPLNLAPTSSTTVALALGDAIASALMAAREFTADDFAKRHPAGSLGKQLKAPGNTEAGE